MLQLYYYPYNASLAPHLLLAETSVDYSLRLVDRDTNAQKSKEYLKLNPSGRIPILVHNELVLFESPAICIYICELDAKSLLIPPTGHPSRPLFFQWLAYLNNTLQAEFMVWRYPETHTTDISGIEGIKASQGQRLVEILTLLDKELRTKPFLLGNNICAADHFLFMLALWCEKLPQPPTSFHNLQRFMRDISRREAVREVCKIEGIDLDLYSG
ncbi:MAG: glutathione S-transferase [Gammaproteobacteria bacterium]|nr:glutathione S-transferase [Gammaproteobacteria bacterium]